MISWTLIAQSRMGYHAAPSVKVQLTEGISLAELGLAYLAYFAYAAR
jgi:hypothetical protein